MKESRKTLLILFLNSLAFYIISYLFLFLPSQFLTYLAAHSFNIPTIFDQYKVAFPIYDNNNLWTQESVVAIYIAAPVAVFILGIFFFRYVRTHIIANKSGLYLFSLWSYVHCINIFFGGLAVGIPIIKGFGLVPAWLYAPYAVSYSLIIISFIIITTNGFFLRRAFASMVISEYYLRSPYLSLQFKTAIAFLPCIIGNSLFFLLKFPDDTIYERLLLFTIFLQFLLVYPFRYFHFTVSEKNANVRFSRLAGTIAIILVLLLVIWKLLK